MPVRRGAAARSDHDREPEADRDRWCGRRGPSQGCVPGVQRPCSATVLEAIPRLLEQLDREAYVADPAIATSLHLATVLRKPLLVEGHAGVGKTEIAKVLARVLQTELIRLQCYEGLDASTALYEWNYSKQLLHIRLHKEGTTTEAQIFSEQFLLKRPLLQAIAHGGRAPVLLVDEIDRSDEEFEAFLLEVLSDFQVSVP